PRQQQYDLSVRSNGIKLQDLKTVKARNIQLTGLLSVEVSGQGTLNDPGLQATLSIPALAIRSQTINNIKLTTGVAHHVAKFSLDSEAMGIHAGSQGTIQLTGDYLADITANTQPLQLQPLLAMYAPAQAADISGQTEVHASLRGPLKQTDQIEAHVEVPQLSLNYKNSTNRAATGPIRADYVRGMLDVKRSSIRGTGPDLTFQASIPRAKDAAISILLEGNVDLALAQMFTPEITSGGLLRF